jgi:hypothetical protein
MKKQRSVYEDNRKILEDEETYPDKNTIALVDLIVDIVVKSTLKQQEAREAEKMEIQLPKTVSDP